jgi:thioredoxin 1
MLNIKKFSADWCSPCRILGPVVESIKLDYKNNTDVKFDSYNIDNDVDEAKKYNVRSIPVIVFEKDGKEVGRIIGSKPKMEIVNMIEKFI